MDYVGVRIDRLGTIYQRLIDWGIMAGRLRQLTPFNDNVWECQFFMRPHDNRDAAKEITRDFLIQAWDATAVTFYQKQGCPRNEFYAKFYSNAL